jgi:DHA3 family multidrug efflux protein-like MFS transporter
MDPYGLSLVSLEVWGVLWGFLSLGFIFGGLFIAKKGLGNNPLRTLLRVNSVLWITCIFFTIQPSIILLAVGMLIYISLVPFIEASEHTVIQKIVPKDRQGRVFGFAQSVESAASPLTAFFIGPIAQFIFIPFMTTGKGVDWIGGWFGTGDGRGIALVFSLAGILGLIATIIAVKSKAYALLSKRYLE